MCLREGLCCRLSPISVLAFEEYLLRKAADILGIKITITPSYTIYEKKRGVYIALSYVLELKHGKCPFLSSENTCFLHGFYKPLVCRSFPYIPKEVRYFYNTDMKVLVVHVEYALSRKCPVIEKNIKKLYSALNSNPLFLSTYMPNEVRAAIEMEEKRALIMRLLSILWKKGFVELDLDKERRGESDNVINVYDILRVYYPNLPYILGIYKAVASLKTLSLKR